MVRFHTKDLSLALLKRINGEKPVEAKEKKRTNKYGVGAKEKRTWDEIVYDSIHEMRYAQQLHLRLLAGEITTIERQVRYDFVINDVKVCRYVLDFRVTYPDGRIEYIDAKGYRTPEYRIKAKLMLAVFGITITEV